MRKNCFNYNKIKGVKKECPLCHKMIGITAFNRHVKSCKGKKVDKLYIDHDDGRCSCGICGKVFENKNSLRQHYSYCSGNKTIWNKGLTKEIDERVNNSSIKTSTSQKGRPGVIPNKETRKKLSEAAKRNNFGGHTSKKAIYYIRKDGTITYLQSSYEVSVATSLDNYDIAWIRPNPLLWIDSNSIEHRYYPDFYLVDHDVYLDPKNSYLIRKDKLKINTVCSQNNVRILVLTKEQLNWESIKALL